MNCFGGFQLPVNAPSRDRTIRFTAMLSLIALLVLSCPGLAVENDRANEAATIFNSYCLNVSSGAAVLEHRATEAHYEVIVDRSIPTLNGQVIKQKNWLIPSKGGAAIMLTSEDGMNVDGSKHVFGCGVYIPDVDIAAMESALSALPRLGSPTKRSQGKGGPTSAWWLARVGASLPSEDSPVMLSGDVPVHRQSHS